jgi:regulator of protease activity HflC (stomatin/prohibitin superfamily)
MPEVAMNMILTFPLILLVFLLLVASVKILREYQRAVVFQLGRFWKVKGPACSSWSRWCSRWCAWTCARS